MLGMSTLCSPTLAGMDFVLFTAFLLDRGCSPFQPSSCSVGKKKRTASFGRLGHPPSLGLVVSLSLFIYPCTCTSLNQHPIYTIDRFPKLLHKYNTEHTPHPSPRKGRLSLSLSLISFLCTAFIVVDGIVVTVVGSSSPRPRGRRRRPRT